MTALILSICALVCVILHWIGVPIALYAALFFGVLSLIYGWKNKEARLSKVGMYLGSFGAVMASSIIVFQFCLLF